jgi:2-methylisocitrate lyase-like PEP mutase family enzyme
LLPADELADLGYRIAAYPLTLLSSAVQAMQEALAALQDGHPPTQGLMDFEELKRTVGFDDYYAAEARYVRDPSRSED